MLSTKDIKLQCVGFRGMDDEWYGNSNYRQYIKVDKHHYDIHIWLHKEKEWKMMIYLCLTAVNSDDILIAEQTAKTRKELVKAAVNCINSYHNTEVCEQDIERWKASHGYKVFDSNCNYLGISYTNPERESRPSDFNYYNDKKPHVDKGTYYMLYGESVMVCEIGCGWSTTYFDKDRGLRERLLAVKAEM